MTSKTFAIGSITALALVLAACGGVGNDSGGGGGNGGGTGDDPIPTIDHPTGANDLVLRVATGGGFVPIQYNLKAVPGVSIYGDGRMIVDGPVMEIYPGPALPNLQVTRLSEDAIQAILAEARAAGLLGPDASYDEMCVSDMPTTTFTVNADGATHTVSAYALGFGDGTTGETGQCGQEAAARQLLTAFSTKLTDLASWLPQGSLGAEEPYLPSEMRVYVTAYQGDPQLEQTPIEWPLEGELGRFGARDVNLSEYRCGVISGDDLAAVLPLAQQANELTPWTSAGTDHSLVLRPLLPDEHGC
jgi:hypothetical protein